MIPKVIHYCWFGHSPLPKLAEKCIASWKKFFPDYEIKEWNEGNFDVNIIPYTAEAYQAKKYAFVSDYARFWILYHYGGLYFDTDVEVIKPMDDIIAKGPFMGCELDAEGATALAVAPGLGLGVNPGLGLGVNPGLCFYKIMLQMYSKLNFIERGKIYNLETIVSYTTKELLKVGLKNEKKVQFVAGIYIYPQEYFCPLHVENNRKVLSITSNTYTIHHWAASWQPKSKEFLASVKWKLMDVFGTKLVLFTINLLQLRKLRKLLHL